MPALFSLRSSGVGQVPDFFVGTGGSSILQIHFILEISISLRTRITKIKIGVPEKVLRHYTAVHSSYCSPIVRTEFLKVSHREKSESAPYTSSPDMLYKDYILCYVLFVLYVHLHLKLS